MNRLVLIGLVAAILSPQQASAKADPFIWPHYQETESVVLIPPMGIVIDERWPDIDFRDIAALRAAPTDSNCEAFDARHGAGAAARVMNEK